MKRRSLLAGSLALAAGPRTLAHAQGKRIKIVFWHSMSATAGEVLNLLVNGFNISQKSHEVTAVFKEGYPETLTAIIAASKAGHAPHLVQIFDIGAIAMLTAGPAVRPAWELAKEGGAGLAPDSYFPVMGASCALADGRLASMPFNASTALMWYNKTAFEKAGLDPEKPPATWAEVVKACQALKAKAAAPVPMTTSWPAWIQLEQFSAIHNLPYATRANGFEGLNAELKLNGPAQVKQVQRLLDLARDGLFKYAGRGGAGDALFVAGEAAIGFASSGLRAGALRNATFRWAAALLPTDPEVNPKPVNSTIDGASLWTMTAPERTADEYRGVAEFLKFIALPENDASWHQKTGYMPVTPAGYELSRTQGFYEKNPGADLSVVQLIRGQVAVNSRGLRLGRMTELRDIVEEELEKALGGQQTARQALDGAAVRGNKVLRAFEKSAKA